MCQDVFINQWRRLVLLFGAETWVLTPRRSGPCIASRTGSSHGSPGGNLIDGGGGIWEYLHLAEAMGEVGFEGIRKLVTRRQNTGVQYILTRPILDLCEQVTQRPGARVSRRWWE